MWKEGGLCGPNAGKNRKFIFSDRTPSPHSLPCHKVVIKTSNRKLWIFPLYSTTQENPDRLSCTQRYSNPWSQCISDNKLGHSESESKVSEKYHRRQTIRFTYITPSLPSELHDFPFMNEVSSANIQAEVKEESDEYWTNGIRMFKCFTGRFFWQRQTTHSLCGGKHNNSLWRLSKISRLES